MQTMFEEEGRSHGLWTALVLAGERPGIDPLATHFGQRYKALIPVRGAPMISHVVASLLLTPQIRNIVILAQDPEAFRSTERHWLASIDRVTVFASQAGIAQSISAFLREAPQCWPCLITTADHPLLMPEMVRDFLAGVGHADLAVAAVEKKRVDQAYPTTQRTWLHFSDGSYSGANLFALRTERVRPALDLWHRAERDRKQAWRLFRHFGLLLALRAIFRQIDFGTAITQAGRRLGLHARLVALSDPDAAVDVDKLNDLILVEHILAARQAAPPDESELPERAIGACAASSAP